MANFVFNVALGRLIQKADDGATLKLLLLKAAAAESVLRDMTTVAAVLADASTTECDFTNYARATLASVAEAVDHTEDEATVDCADISFEDAGGATNNDVVAAVVYQDVTDDSDSIPLLFFDAVITTTGTEFVLKVPTNGFFAAEQKAA